MFKKVILSLFLISFYILTGFAQEDFDYENPQEYEIAGIQTKGIRYLDNTALIHVTGLSVGQKVMIPGDEITYAIKKLWEQKMFSDVKIYSVKTEGNKIWLEISLEERPRLSEVKYYGIKNSDQEELNDKLNLVKGRQITQNTLVLSENIIKQYYADKGFSKTKIRIFKKQDTTYQNAVILNIYIDKFKKTRIENFDIDGNTVFKMWRLKWFKLKDTKERRWYGLFKPSKYIESKYEDDKKKLIAAYNKEGYRDAKIVVDSVYDANDRNLNIYIKVDEGKQYFFRDIKWIGNSIYSTALLNKKLQIKKGDIYDQEKLTARMTVDADAVGNLYMDNGYLFFNIRAVEKKIENDSVDIELRMYEGPKARINKITIKGNDRTNDNVIRRELYTVPGELFSKSDIIRSVRELATLGHFDPEQIIPTPIPNPSNGTVDLEYSLVERGNDRVEISGGWGAGMLVGRLGLSFNNFSIQNIFEKKAWRPLPTGDGQKLSLNAQTNGSAYQYYSVSFQEPWLGGKKPNSLSVSFYYNIQTNKTYYNLHPENLQTAKVAGISVGFGRRLKWPDNYFTLYHALGYQHYKLDDWLYRSYIRDITNGSYNNFTISTTFGRNSVDNPLYSRRGSEFSLGLELTPPYSLFGNKDYPSLSDQEKFKWIEYHKWTFKARWFTQIWGDLVFHTKTEFGYLGYYNKKIGYSPLGGYRVGGSGMAYYTYGVDIVGLRGYKDGELTLADGANIYTKYTMELRYPVVNSESATIFALAFAEAGNAWHDTKTFNPFIMKRSAGVGVRIFLPMLGQLGFDWGYGFDPQPGEIGPHGSEFHFTMGQQF
ncbi:MAG: outer membrane protein assembly factor BamA [Bacteroidales bacterium]|nr:outer membrane protein assembly factor BamA [Bacteroidales bacterium]